MLLAIACVFMGCGGGTWPSREGIILPDGVYVLHLPGIMGDVGFDESFAHGLITGGVQDVQLVDWTRFNPFANLSNESVQQGGADMLRDRLREVTRRNRRARVVITAHSGGAEPVLLALEQMSPREARRIEQVWLLAPAVSPERDLTAAAARTRRLVNVFSPHDWLLLGLGTSLMGTADGIKSDSAGRRGFRNDLPNLEQWPYQKGWKKFRYSGNHVSILHRDFAEHVVAPSMIRWVPPESAPPAVTRPPSPVTSSR